MLKKIFAIALIATFPLMTFGADQEASTRRINVRVNPLLIAIGGNIDFDVYINSKFTLGPSFFGWGGCGARQTGTDAKDGAQCDTYTAFGLRANYYFDFWDSPNLIYIGPGLYQTKKSISYRYNSQNLSGEISGTTVTALVGYLYQSPGAFNVSAGIGGIYFLDKKSDLLVSNGSGIQTTISTGSSTQLLLEASLGWRF